MAWKLILKLQLLLTPGANTVKRVIKITVFKRILQIHRWELVNKEPRGRGNRCRNQNTGNTIKIVCGPAEGAGLQKSCHQRIFAKFHSALLGAFSGHSGHCKTSRRSVDSVSMPVVSALRWSWQFLRSWLEYHCVSYKAPCQRWKSQI